MAVEGGSARVALDKVEQALGRARARRAVLAREKARAEFLEVSAPMRSKVLGSLKLRIRTSLLADPDMWPCVRSAGTALVDEMLADVEKEIERSLQAALLQQQRDANEPGPSGGVFCPWYRLRAFVLHHYLPHDKMLFGKLKDPAYVLLYLATLVPAHGVRVCIFALLLLMLVLPGRPDEFQLINFILLCKGMQFLTSGLIQLAVGAGKYFACYSGAKAELLECVDRHGPGAGDGIGLAVDYLGSIALVWVAFGLLGRSEKHGPDRHQAATAEEAEKAEKAGGRLRSLLVYDRTCFFLSNLWLLALTACTCPQHFVGPAGRGLRGLAGDPQFSANIYWCCVGYSVLSMPFAPFMVSGLQEVMTHCYATGFNRHGACVPFELPSAELEGPVPAEEACTQDLTSYCAAQATNILRTVNRGRAMRGAGEDYALEDIVGDFSRGVWALLTGAQPLERSAEGLP